MKAFEGKFHLELSEPRKVVQGAVGDQAWGHYNFPGIARTKTGALICRWAYGEDKVGGVHHDGGVRPPYVSYDGGISWGPNVNHEEKAPGFRMSNGKYFLGFCGREQVKKDYIAGMEPAVRWGEHKMFFAEDFGAMEDTVVKAQIYDPVTDTVETYAPKVNWPYAPLVCWPGDIVYPVTQIFALNNVGVTQLNGILYICLYMHGFDSAAKSREEAVMKYSRFYSTYVFSSEDCGQSWNYLSQISVTDEFFDEKPNFEGFCEPMMEQMPDGSFVMLMRTGSGHTSYLARSVDGGKSWSKPRKFDDFGVLPQILTLPCGVTLAAYGRPKLRIRATADPSGLVWEEPITVPLSAPVGTSPFQTSCFYTDFLPLDDTTVLWVYTDFQHPNEQGEPAKAVLVREVKVVRD